MLTNTHMWGPPAGGHAKNTLLTFGSLDVFDTRRCLLLVPASRGSTWDMIRFVRAGTGGYTSRSRSKLVAALEC